MKEGGRGGGLFPAKIENMSGFLRKFVTLFAIFCGRKWNENTFFEQNVAESQ
jgi:hypothetical protein